LTAVVEALPAIVAAGLVGGITCFISITVVSLAAIFTEVAAVVLAITSENDAELEVVLVTKILVTIVVVLVLGWVYRVVLVVAAAVRASTLDVVAISYYIPFC
jgi:hypothetical protein